MSVFTVEENKKKPKTCEVTICCDCGNTFKTKMYDISEHGFAYVNCEKCNKRYGAKYKGWIIEQLKE